MGDSYEIAIIGAGPAGLTAALYASRAGHTVAVFEKEFAGGQLMLTEIIDNYPGVPTSTQAFDLADQMKGQAIEFGAELISREIVAIDGIGEEGPKTLRLKDSTVSADAVIMATGSHPRRLGIPGEDKFWGRGVSACGTCDGHFYKGRDIVVIGGGDTAVEEATFLARLVNKITLIHRRDRLRADYTLQQRLMSAGDMLTIRWNATVNEIVGDDHVTGVNINDVETGDESFVPCDGVFIFIGHVPNTDLVIGQIETDETGFIVTDDNMATSAAGMFACGDVRHKILRQIVTACGDGATAAFAAQRYVDAQKGTLYE